MDVREASAAYAELSASPVDSLRPGYRHTEVGVIPDDWGASIIGALANTSSGTTPPRSMSERYFDRGDIPWVKTLDLNNSEIRVTDEKVTAAALSETSLQVYPAGSVLVAMYGGYNQIGRAGLLRVAAAVNQALTAIVPNDRVLDSTYLLHMLNYRVDYWRVVASSSRKDPNITGKDVAQFPLALPSIREQQAIAEALSDADALIESLEQLIAKKRQIKQGTMQALLTGKQCLPGFQSEWARRSLGELFDFSGGYSASRDQLSVEGHCYLHYGDIHTSTKSFVDVAVERQKLPKLDIPLNKINASSLLKDGDVVFVDASEDDEGTSRHMVISNVSNVPFIAGLHTIVAKSKTDELDHLFRRYCFQAADVKQQFRFFAVGTKVSGVSKSNIGKIELSVPPIAEQTAIATILTDMDTELAELETRLAKTRQLKQGMMQELLTGRIRLVQPASTVVPLSKKRKEAPAATAKPHNQQINEAVVIAALTKNFGSEEWPLARVRRTKLAYLLHRHAEGRADGFLKKAAGPYDPRVRYKGPEGIALKKGYVRTRHNGKYEGFVASENIAEAEAYFEKWYGAGVMTWLEQFHMRKTEELELLTTVDMAVEDLRRGGKSVGVDAVKQLIHDHPEWKPKLDRTIFSDDGIAAALAECQTLFES